MGGKRGEDLRKEKGKERRGKRREKGCRNEKGRGEGREEEKDGEWGNTATIASILLEVYLSIYI